MSTTEISQAVWRKSSRCSGSDCVELAWNGDLVRDSKNPAGEILKIDIRQFVQSIKDLH